MKQYTQAELDMIARGAYKAAWKHVRELFQIKITDEDYEDFIWQNRKRIATASNDEMTAHAAADDTFCARQTSFTGWVNKRRLSKWQNKANKPLYKITS